MKRVSTCVAGVLVAVTLVAGAAVQAAPTGGTAAKPHCFGARSRDPLRPCVNRALDFMSVPSPYDAPLEPSAPCAPFRAAAPEVCTFGTAAGRSHLTFALIGDSHSTHWRAGLAVAARAKRWYGLSINRSNCPFTLAHVPGHGHCRGWTSSVLRFLRHRSDVRFIVVSANSGASVTQAPARTHRQTKMGGYERAWAAVPQSVQAIFVLRDVPHAALKTQACVTKAVAAHHNAGTTCARSRTQALRPDLEAEAAAESIDPRVDPIDLSDLMCDAHRCFPVVGGALVIKDVGHLTRTFSASMGPFLRRSIDGLLPQELR